MSPASALLIQKIRETCSAINLAGEWLAFFSIYTPINTLEVALYRAGQPPVAGITIKACYDSPAHETLSQEARNAHIEHTVQALANALEPFCPQNTPAMHCSIRDSSLERMRLMVLAGGTAEISLNTGCLSHTATLSITTSTCPGGYQLQATLRIYDQVHSITLSPRDGIYLKKLCEWNEGIATAEPNIAA